jgi:hypothetical protein
MNPGEPGYRGPETYDEFLAEVKALPKSLVSATAERTYKFQNVSCSQCGGEFGPGDSGFSHCSSHDGRAEGWSAEELDQAMEWLREQVEAEGVGGPDWRPQLLLNVITSLEKRLKYRREQVDRMQRSGHDVHAEALGSSNG